MREGDDTLLRRVGRRPGDALAAVLDAVGLARARGRGVRRRRRRRRRVRLLQRLPRRRRPRRSERPMPAATAPGTRASRTTSGSSTWRSTACRDAACSSTSSHHLGHDAKAVKLEMLQEIMAADNVVVEPGDMLLLHTGFATKVLEWNKDPDPVKIHRMCAALDPRDESLLEWIADSQISALVADNYAVEAMLGGGPLGRRQAHAAARSTTCACSSSACRSARCGTSTSSRRGCASTTGAGSCSPLPRCACPGIVGSPAHPDRDCLTRAVTRAPSTSRRRW